MVLGASLSAAELGFEADSKHQYLSNHKSAIVQKPYSSYQEMIPSCSKFIGNSYARVQESLAIVIKTQLNSLR